MLCGVGVINRYINEGNIQEENGFFFIPKKRNVYMDDEVKRRRNKFAIFMSYK